MPFLGDPRNPLPELGLDDWSLRNRQRWQVGDWFRIGPDHDGRVKIDDPPRLRWCEHCQADGYVWSSS